MNTLKQRPSDLHRQQKEAKQKMLDKLKKKAYNTLKGREGDNPSSFSFDSPLLDYSINKFRSTMVFNQIKYLLGVASEACKKEGYPRPIISGGAIRDGLHGVLPKDYDIFVDITGIVDDELSPDDRFHLLVDKMFPLDDGWEHKREDKEAYRKMDNHFLVFTCRKVGGNSTVQVIGRYDPLISQENPLDFTNDFPYNIIKGVAYDDTIVVSPEALKGFETREILCADGGYAKALDWRARYRYSKDGRPWKVIPSISDQKQAANAEGLASFSEYSRKDIYPTLQDLRTHGVRHFDYEEWMVRRYPGLQDD